MKIGYDRYAGLKILLERGQEDEMVILLENLKRLTGDDEVIDDIITQVMRSHTYDA